MGGTMGRLSIGVTALQTSQYALNATAHNLTNTQTDGYSRQQVMLTDRTYNSLGSSGLNEMKSGLGVVTAEVKQVRDIFADASYRTESGRMNFYKAQYEATSEIENYFGELEGSDFNTTINDLWTSLQELQKESNSIVTRSSFIATAQNFLDRAKEIRSSLISYQRNINVEIKDQIERINEIAVKIKDLNKDILAAESSKVENANDFRDERNLLLDELSGLIDTEIINNTDGTVEVYVEGRCLVTRGKTYTIGAEKIADHQDFIDDPTRYDFISDSTDFLMPVWADDQKALFNIERVPSAETNSDIGSLKGLIMARGYFVSNYTDVPQKPEKPLEENYPGDPAGYQRDIAQYTIDYRQYQDDLNAFNKYVEPYTITNLMGQFDVLIHAVVTQINDTLCPNKEVTLSDGSTVRVLDTENAAIGMGNNNEYPGTELFTRNNVSRYVEQTLTLADGTTGTYQVFNEEDANDFYSIYSMGNIDVNIELQQNPSLLPLSRVSGEEAQDVVDNLLALWDNKFATVSPNSLVECNFKDYYAGVIDELSDRGYTYNSMAETQQQTIVDIEGLRQSVAGVASDEELSNLIKFQHAYNAASRYITTVAEMIEHLITTLGS